MQIVLGNIVRFKTRFLYDYVLGRASWNSSVKITPEALGELRFWNYLNSSGVEICNLNTENTFDSDASDVGFGGYLSACLVDPARFLVTGTITKEFKAPLGENWRTGWCSEDTEKFCKKV
ncbi:hypothetical protein SNE40_002775 [Patella caerulea]|uniref:Uncharacterized protein n=1 Tax=Patella caerulea TaxID=87958 RepID=A0AAN8KCJ6_PATCE